MLDYRDAIDSMINMRRERTLAERLGVASHVSALRVRLLRLMKLYPVPTADTLEDWLIEVANCRGIRVIIRSDQPPSFLNPRSDSFPTKTS